MALVDLSKRSAVRRAIDEFDRLGREASARAGRFQSAAFMVSKIDAALAQLR
jgi:hypothetical protein